MIEAEMTILKVLGLEKEVGIREVKNIISGVQKTDSLEEFIQTLTKDLNQMEKELFLKGFLLAKFTEGMADLVKAIDGIKK